MRHGYILVDGRMGEAPQRKILEDAGIAPKEIHVDTDTVAQPKIQWFVEKKLRPKSKDTVEVAYLHRLGTNSDAVVDNIDALTGRNAVIVEAATGARSDRLGLFSKALHDSILFLSGKLSRADRSKIAKANAAKSPRTKAKVDGDRLAVIQTIMNQHDKYPRVADAIDAINARRGKLPRVSAQDIYRLAKRGKITLTRRIAGPKSVTD